MSSMSIREISMKALMVIAMCFGPLSLAGASVNSGIYTYFSNTPRPSVSEQRNVAIQIITDALLSPSLAAVAVVQSPIDTIHRIRNIAPHVPYYQFMEALNFDFAFVAETLYGNDRVPLRIAVIQDQMFMEKYIGRRDLPRNYRDRLLHHDDSMWLVFLKEDHVLNYIPSSTIQAVMRQINNAIDSSASKDDVLQNLGIAELLPSNSMFSLVEEYSSFLIDAPGPKLEPVVRERRREFHPELPVPDHSTEFIFSNEFCDDIVHILSILSSEGNAVNSGVIDLKTEEGRAVYRRVLNRVEDGASLAHLNVKRMNRRRPEATLPPKEEVVFSVVGTVSDDEGQIIAEAQVRLIGTEANPLPRDGLAETDDMGNFSIKLDRPLLSDIRTLVYAEGYARTPGILAIESMTVGKVELIVQRGQSVNLDVRVNIDSWKEKPIEGWGLAIIATSLRYPVPVAIVVDKIIHPRQEEDILFVDLESARSINLIPGEYDLVWFDRDDRLVIELGRYVLGESRYKRIEVHLPDPEDIEHRTSLQRLFRGDTGLDRVAP